MIGTFLTDGSRLTEWREEHVQVGKRHLSLAGLPERHFTVPSIKASEHQGIKHQQNNTPSCETGATALPRAY